MNDAAKLPASVSRAEFLNLFLAVFLPMFLAAVDQTLLATATPAIAATLGGLRDTSWIAVGYLLASATVVPVYGRMGDLRGRREMLLVALAIFAIGSLACGLAQSLPQLVAARMLQGLGGGGLMTLSQAMIGEAIPPRERARYQGYIATVAVTANTFGPVAGGYLTEHFGWQSIFLINVPIGLIAIALTLRLPVRHHPDAPEWRADPAGLILFTLFVVTTLLALEQAQRADMSVLPLAGGMGAVGLIALVLLVRHENRMPTPLIPLGLLRMPAIWRSDAMAACHGAALVSLITFLPVYLQAVRGASPSETGLLLVPLTVGVASGSVVTGRLVHKTGLTTAFPIVGMALVTVNLVALALWADVLGKVGFAAMLLWNGVCMGTVMGVVQVVVQTASGPRRLGEAAASVQFSRSMGAGFGTALVAALLFAVLALKEPHAASVFAAMVEHAPNAGANLSGAERAAIQADIREAFRAAFLLIAGFEVMGFFLALSHPVRRI